MNYYFGIYGYEITKRVELENLLLVPVVTNFTEAKKLALDKNEFKLTAIGQIKNNPSLETLFDLSGAFTFIQQQWVVVSKIYEATEKIEDMMGNFPQVFETINSCPTSGALFLSDIFDPGGREKFLKLCIAKLNDEEFEKETNFRKAFFRNVESWRMSNQLIDLIYYLDFSALEILSRTIFNDTASNVAELAARLLNQHGFSVTQDNIQDRRLGMQTYAHLRNSLFHNGEFKKIINENGNTVTLKLTDYDSYLRSLIPDLLLKILGYENDTINWNRWLNGNPFK